MGLDASGRRPATLPHDTMQPTRTKFVCVYILLYKMRQLNRFAFWVFAFGATIDAGPQKAFLEPAHTRGPTRKSLWTAQLCRGWGTNLIETLPFGFFHTTHLTVPSGSSLLIARLSIRLPDRLAKWCSRFRGANPPRCYYDARTELICYSLTLDARWMRRQLPHWREIILHHCRHYGRHHRCHRPRHHRNSSDTSEQLRQRLGMTALKDRSTFSPLPLLHNAPKHEGETCWVWCSYNDKRTAKKFIIDLKDTERRSIIFLRTDSLRTAAIANIPWLQPNKETR